MRSRRYAARAMRDGLRRRGARQRSVASRRCAGPAAESRRHEATLSTRGTSPELELSARRSPSGLAPDGGLFVPQSLPRFARRAISPASKRCRTSPRACSTPFFAGDALAAELSADLRRGVHVSPRRCVRSRRRAITCSSFSTGRPPHSRISARAFSLRACAVFRAPGSTTADDRSSRHRATPVPPSPPHFTGVPGFRVVILYPDGRVSPRQAHQLGCFGGNVRALRVAGSFDDCQRLVKQALGDRSCCKPALPLTRPTASASAACCRR